MPVFHTKTIESILEPVAQQVSKLVLLQEDAENGNNKMPDLSAPVQVVRMAADNLIKVGYETIDVSEDSILKTDMPQALNRVQDACKSLLSASELLKLDPTSIIGKKQLIDGERGILYGVSAILLTFDESEVRKLIETCKQVLDYFIISVDIIDKMDDLVAYVKNLTPILTKMTRDIGAREKELTHQIHREFLVKYLEDVKNLTPSFISSIKTYLTIKYQAVNANSDGQTNILNEAEQNRDFIIRKMCDKINEIIRILQLTKYEEDEWFNDAFLILKKRLISFESHLKYANEWLNDQNGVLDGIGEKAFLYTIDDALAIANKINDVKQKQIIFDECDKLHMMRNGLRKFIKEGDRNSQTAIQLATLMDDHLIGLYNTLRSILNSTSNNNGSAMAHSESFSSMASNKLAPTVFGKVDQASKWCKNPFYDDNGTGEEAARHIITDARRIAHNHKDAQISEDFLKLSNECEACLDTLVYYKNSKVNSNEVVTTGKVLQDKLSVLGLKIKRTLIQQVADDFIDINTPVKKLAEIAVSPFEIPNRDTIFRNTAETFQRHTEKLCETAVQISDTSLQSFNKRTIEEINELAIINTELAPQVVNAARILFRQPKNKVLHENFDLMQKQWQDSMDQLRCIVDANIDTEAFIRACEYSILKDTHKVEIAYSEQNNYDIVAYASNIARRANRIVQIAQQEIENSEDTGYVEQVKVATNLLKTNVPKMIYKAKTLATEPENRVAFDNWSISNQDLIDSVAKIREAVTSESSQSDESATNSSIPDMTTLSLSKDRNSQELAPPRPPFPKLLHPERPPLPVSNETDDDSEVDFPLPNANQPILVMKVPAAAHDLHVSVEQWSSKDNDLVAITKRITLLMAKLNDLVKSDGCSNKKQLISTAKELADESIEITRVAKQLAQECTDKRMRNNLLQVCERIPTIGTQLKILSTVKATTILGAHSKFDFLTQKSSSKLQHIDVSQDSREDEEATEMLIVNAQNLNASIQETVRAAKSASIKMRTDAGFKLKWVRKRTSFRRFN